MLLNSKTSLLFTKHQQLAHTIPSNLA